MSFTQDDYQYMSRALYLAKKGLNTTDPNPRVGCVIVKDKQIVGEGWHSKAGEAHAEVNALAMAKSEAAGATVYVTLEPCCHQGKTPPCSQALIKARVANVIVAMRDPHDRVAGGGIAELEAAGIDVKLGLLEEQARELNPGFIKRMEHGRPYVRVKMAMSLDGRTAMASGESKWITGEAARQDVQKLRARSSVVLSGIGTVLNDDPSLNVRLENTTRQPVRVILDTQLHTPVNAKLFMHKDPVWIFCDVEVLKQSADKAGQLQQAGARVFAVESVNSKAGKPELVIEQVLEKLAQEQVNEILVEAGASLAGAFLAARCVDEIVVYMAPCIMGSQARPLFSLPLDAMSEKVELDIKALCAVGEDWRIVAKPRYL